MNYDLKESRRIVGAMVMLHLHYTAGVPLAEDDDAESIAKFLRSFSLLDLVEANRLARMNSTEETGDGAKTIHTTVDDRVIAALYTALHYDPQPNHGHVTPIAELHDRALCLVTMEREEAVVNA